MESVLNEILPLESENHVIKSDRCEFINFDSHPGVSIWQNNNCFGVSVCSKGLHDYYDILEEYSDGYMPEKLEDALEKAIEKTESNWVITQMQGIKENGKPNGFNYRNDLVRFWIDTAKKAELEELYYLSADLVSWNLPPVKFAMIDQDMPAPDVEHLKSNYDYVAKRFKFEYDSKTRLYRKEL